MAHHARSESKKAWCKPEVRKLSLSDQEIAILFGRSAARVLELEELRQRKAG